MRLIDADKFNNFDYDDDRGNEFDSPKEAYAQGVEYVLNEIDKAPTVDAQEVKYGKWIDRGWHTYSIECTAHFYKCSICQHKQIGMSKHCPNCGARMEVSDEEQLS